MDRNVLNDLIQEVKKRDETAFEKLFDASKNEVYGFLYLYTKNSRDAKNILRKTYVKIRETVQGYQDGTDAFSWIIKTAHLTALEFLKRKNKSEDVKGESEPTVVENKKKKDAKPSIYDIINSRFEDTDRQILLLKVAYGYKNKEIAEILHIPNATVPWKYGNIKKEFADALVEAEYDPTEIRELISAENENADVKMSKDVTKTPIQEPRVKDGDKIVHQRFFTSAPFISSLCCLAVALILFLVSSL